MGERAGRRERPVDPTDGPAAAFAVELRKLREEAGGPTYRAMAARAHFSAATLAQAAAGDRMPTLPVALAYVEACDGDTQEWRARWEEARAAQREHAARNGETARAPYRGLARFETEDQAYFFGRSALVERLVTLLEAHRFVLVVGPSGSGKSSLLRAGLVPALRGRAVRVLTPGAHPRLPGDAADVLVIDQFEETFTLCEDPAERRSFIDALVAAGGDDRRTRVVLAVRADFFGQFTHHSDLVEAVRDATVPVGPMSPAELREAIVKPAAAAGLIVQRELTNRILDEVAGQPGGLPLMSHALLETWRRHHGKALTVEAYEAAGGISGAVARTSEELYEELTPEQRERLRHLLLRLVTPGEAGAQDTRRPAACAELVTGCRNDPSPLLLERLACARLITLDDETADLAHEALLTAWPRLRSWVEEDRERLRMHRRLTEAADAWQAHARDPGGLYRGLRLSLARRHLAERAEELTPLERDFLAASTAGRRGERRRSRLRNSLIGVLTTVVMITGLLAWQQNLIRDRQEREAQARRAAGIAAGLRQTDPQLSMRLSLAAWRLADLPETRANLRTASLQAQQEVFTDPDTGAETMRRLSPDGRSLYSLGADRAVRWDVETHRAITTTPVSPVTKEDRESPRWLPLLSDVSSKVSGVRLWDVTTGRRDPKSLDGANQGVELAPSGQRLITYHADGSHYRVRVWDAAVGRLIAQVRTPRKGRTAQRIRERPSILMAMRAARDGRSMAEVGVPDATLSADDTTMALCVPGGPVRVWDLRTGRELDVPHMPTLSAKQCGEERLYLSPDGRRLLMAADAEVRLWELPSGRELPAVREPGVSEIGFSEDGAFFATANSDELLVWRAGTLDTALFRHPLAGEHAFDIRVDPAADWVRYLAGSPNAGSWPATVRTLKLNSVVDAGWQNASALSAFFSPDGNTLATVYANRVELRDTRTGRRLPGPSPVPCKALNSDMPECHMTAAFRPDGKGLAYGDTYVKPFSVQVWDLAGQRVVGRFGPFASAGSLAYTWDSGTLLISEPPMNGSLTLWDLKRGAATATVPGVSGEIALAPDGRLLVTSGGQVTDLVSDRAVVRANGFHPASVLTFSADGRFLAVGDQTGQTTLWDGTVRRQLGTLIPASPYASDWVSSLAFSADGSVLAAGMANGTVQLWDTATWQPIGAPISTPVGFVAGMTIDGDTLYVAGEHVPLRRYDLDLEVAARTVCRRAGHGLDLAEWATHFPGYPYQATCA
ncbi:hypothetical protein ABT340_09195 [Streptosporangium sp. NPDC000239]|uniref:nSTAND1 domain-containing NTPase n=1 Tax=Streptosporangium sp. NPDC000239 TaxID=3154248 RepID=UPI003322DCA5